MATPKGIFERDGKWWHFVRHGSKNSTIVDDSGNMRVVPTSELNGIKLRSRWSVHDEAMRALDAKHEAEKLPPSYGEDVVMIQRLRDSGLLLKRWYDDLLELWGFKVLRQASPDERAEIMATWRDMIEQQRLLTREFDAETRYVDPAVMQAELQKHGVSRAYELDARQRHDVLWALTALH